jgi:hypothetical protein
MADVLQQIGNRNPRPGMARRLGKDLAAITTEETGLLEGSIDEKEMSASFVICSRTEDRESDIIEPQGCREFLDEYRRNPIVLYDHNHDECLPPIGLSEDKGGKFSLRIFDDRITAKCYFHGLPFKGQNVSEEVFDLVVKGALRGASVGFIPLPEGTENIGYGRGGGKFYKAWRLTEWSITPLQSNQDCLRAALSRGLVKTKSLRDHLSAYLPAAPVWANGVDLEPLMSKRRVASIQFAKNLFPDAATVQKWLKASGRGQGKVESVGAVWSVGMGPGGVCTGTKNLAKGVTALLVTKAGKDDEEEDKPKPKEEGDDAPPAKPEDDAPVPPETPDDETPAPEGEEEVPPGKRPPLMPPRWTTATSRAPRIWPSSASTSTPWWRPCPRCLEGPTIPRSRRSRRCRPLARRLTRPSTKAPRWSTPAWTWMR